MFDWLSPHFTAFALVLAAAVVLDLRDRRIPNGLTVAGLAAGLTFGAILNRGMPTGELLGAGLALILGFMLFALGGIGAGDAKLFAAVGAFVGPEGVLVTIIYGGIAGGVIVFVDAWRRGRIMALLQGTKDVLFHLVSFGRFGQKKTLSTPGATALPYGVAIAIGGLAAWFLPLPGGSP